MKHKHITHKKPEIHHKKNQAINLAPQKSYALWLSSKHLPFAVKDTRLQKMKESEETLQKFVKLIEKKFDVIWYIGEDYLGKNMYERFIFHKGGVMEISLNGKMRCFFATDRLEKMKNAIFYANKNLGSENLAKVVNREIKTGQKLISIKNSILNMRLRWV